MSSNCNHINEKCDPCAICTPPGVTNLPDCNPKDPCDQKVNISCIEYSGIDFSCLGVNNGDSLIDVLLAILNQYFPPSYCCELDGVLISNATTTTTSTSTTTSTTSSTTTSTSTTTTTTTVAGVNCICYYLTNTTGSALAYTYVNCETKQTVSASVPASSSVYRCAVDKSIIVPDPGMIIDNTGLCLLGCPSTTTTSTTSTTSTSTSSTTTTTTVPAETCFCYIISNPTLDTLSYTINSCSPLPPAIPQSLGPAQSVSVCSEDGITFDFGLIVLGPLNPCSQGCPATTTTTTLEPCNCYKIQSISDEMSYYEYESCGGTEPPSALPITYPLAPGVTEYFCAKPGTVVFYLFEQVLTLIETSCSLGCPPVYPPPNIECTEEENIVVYNGSTSNIITDLTSVTPGFFIISGIPLNPGEVAKGIHGAYSGGVSIDITSSLAGGCIKILVNGIVQDSQTVLLSGTYILNVTTGVSDCVQIILTDDPCI